MRSYILGAAVFLAACASSPVDAPLDAIEVVYHPETMYYTIEDGGAARIVGAGRVFEFEASRDDFRRIAELLAPLEAQGLTCTSPPEHGSPGHIVFHRGEAERRVVMHTACYADGSRPLARNTDRAWRAMEEMGRARYVAPTIPEPAIIAVERKYWGNTLSSWSVSSAGEGRYVEGDQTQTFAVSGEQFAEIREIFRPYESRHFECQRLVADLPYGDVIWSSREGQEDQRTRFDSGCITGDAGDLFERLDRADAVINRLRDASAP